MAIYCSQGHTNPDDATFCDECGEPLPAAVPASAPSQDEDAPTLPASGAPPAPAEEEAPAPADLSVPQPAPAADFEATQVAPDAAVIPPPTEEADTVTAAPSAPEAFPAPPPMAPEPELPAPPAPPEPSPVAAMPSTPEPEPVAAASAPAAAPVAAQPRLTVEGTTTTFDLVGKASVVLGREDAPSNSFPDIDLTPFGAEEGGVSRLHARLTQSGNAWNIEDLDSTNFTFINRKRIAPKTPTALSDGDEIRLGRVGLRFKTTA